MIGSNNKQPELNNLLVVSEKLTALQSSEYQQNLKDLVQTDQYQLSNNHHGFPFFQKEAQQSETVFTRRESPIKISSQLFKSCESNKGDSIFAYKARDSKQNSEPQKDNNYQKSRIFCQHSLTINQKPCEICKGTGVLEQNNNLVKFFKYLIDFKLSKKPSYVSKRIHFNKNSANSSCSDSLNQSQVIAKNKCNNKNFTFRVNERKSQKPTTNNRSSYICKAKVDENESGHIDYNNTDRFSVRSTTICRKEEIIEEISSTIMIHESHKCDDCMCEPIIGVRYHCNTCQDFDQCQKCYNQVPHLHQMEKIDKTGKAKQLENMLNFLAQPIKLSSSLRPASIKVRSEFISMAKSAMT